MILVWLYVMISYFIPALYVNYVFEQYDDDHSGALDKEGKFRKKVSIHFFS